MKSILLLLTLSLLPAASFANSEKEVIESYVQTAAKQYADSANGAVEFQKKIMLFLATPNGQTLRAAKLAWIEMRKSYSPTEIYRFYGSPIDGDNGPEGLINAWPLDEAYIDYVVGAGNSGIINDLARYPSITKELLEGLNEKDGEKNIAVGYHAIEFLLWGQDLSSSSAGTRPFSDYVIGVGKNADRRREYLKLATELLVEHLQSVSQAWDPSDVKSYANVFSQTDHQEALRRILTGIYTMSSAELSQERMFVAYDTQSQEDEHSCFSDTTHLDLQYNFLGIKNVLAGANGGAGVIDLVATKDANLAKALTEKMLETETNIHSIPAPFDNAIYSTEGREAILKSVTALEDLAVLIKQAGTVLGVEIN